MSDDGICLAKLAPSGSGSGDSGSGGGESGSGSGDSGSGGSSGLPISGSGTLELTPTTFSQNNYRWDIEGNVEWSASGRMVLVDEAWILDTSTLSVNGTININIKGRTYTESGIDYVSVSKKVAPSEIGKITNAGTSASGVARTSVEGYAKKIDTGATIHTHDCNQQLVLTISFVVVAGPIYLEAEMGTISVSLS